MNSYSLKYGLIAGLILALLNVIFLLVNPAYLFDFTINALVGVVTYVFFMYKAIADTRNEDGGYISFGDALLAGLITFAIASFLSIMSMFVISSTSQDARDAELKYTVESMDKVTGMFDKFMDEDQLAQMEEEMEKEKEKIQEQFADNSSPSASIGMVLFGWLMMLFWGLIVSLIMAAILKKSAPLS